MDEIEFARELSKVHVKLHELGNPLLEEVLNTLLDLIESTHDRMTEFLAAIDDDE